MSLISLNNISLSFGKQKILEDFDFVLKKGDKAVVFGESGLGKSTLINLILGFTIPDQGTITVMGKPLNPKNIDWIRSQVAYVDQASTLGEGLVKKRLEEFFSFTHISTKLNQKELHQTLNTLSLSPSIIQKNLSQLSGGERQRLALTIALLLRRPLLILDEATSALDPKSKSLVIKTILRSNSSLLSITHDQAWRKQKNFKQFDFKENKWVQ